MTVEETHLRLTGKQHRILHTHLFPGDGLEAMAFAICGRRTHHERSIFVAQKVILVPHSKTNRTNASVSWSTSILDEILREVHGSGKAVVKLHSHPTGYDHFSSLDDRSDKNVLVPFCTLLGDSMNHASVVMMPDGKMFGRVLSEEGIGSPLASIQVVDDELQFYFSTSNGNPDFALRTSQAFGQGTTELMRKLRIAVVGCSGTGSIVAELLARLGVGCLVLVDPDHIEIKNLNRIINSRRIDAEAKARKVNVLAGAIEAMGLGTRVISLPLNLDNRRAVCEVASCDAVFGCMDSVEGRHLLNRLASFYLLPYFDVGVKLDADGKGGINGIAGAVHYIQPGCSSLYSRGMYSLERVRTEELRRTTPELYAQQCDAGYLRGVVENSPAVISVNMLIASLAANEFLARLHPFRNISNTNFAYVGFSLSEMQVYSEKEGEPCKILASKCGLGDVEPLLERSSLS